MKVKSQAKKAVPVKTLRACEEAESDHSHSHSRKELQVTSTSAFTLPPDWLVVERPRSFFTKCPGKIDRYYIEPKTGKKFSSLIAVERYLTDGKTEPSKSKISKESGNKCTKLITFPPTESTSDFRLPDDWIIEKKKRRKGNSSGVVDKYYVEPGTGHRFRSLIAVKRHLKQSNRSTMPLKIQFTRLTSKFVLPDGWSIEKKQRRCCYERTFDKYYVEPGTGRRFRSLVAVERHLEEAKEVELPLIAFKRPQKHLVSCSSDSWSENAYDEIQGANEHPKGNAYDEIQGANEDNKENAYDEIQGANEHPTKSKENATMPKEVIPPNDSGPSAHSDKLEKNSSGEEVEASMDDFGCPPSSINWILAGPGGDMWSPFFGQSMVSESTKQKWSETFISSIHVRDENSHKPGF